MATVGVRELKARLSHYLRRVGRGERIVVTARGRAVGVIGPAAGSALRERLEAMLRSGKARWAGSRTSVRYFTHTTSRRSSYGGRAAGHAIPEHVPDGPAESCQSEREHLRLRAAARSQPQARIVWLHAGWDLTGERTVALMRFLLSRHADLFISIKSDRAGTPLTSHPNLATASSPSGSPSCAIFLSASSSAATSSLMTTPSELIGQARSSTRFPGMARLVASENVKHIYRLPASRR
jgi:prevent-host-death family protein